MSGTRIALFPRSSKAAEWARHDPDAAMAWAESFPPGPERDAAMIGAASGQRDPLAILAFLDEHGWGVDFTNSARGYSSSGSGGGNSYNGASMVNVLPRALRHLVGEGRAAEAFARVAQVPDRSMRDNMFAKTVEAWIKEDAAAATEWLIAIPESLTSSARFIAEGLDSIAAAGDSTRVAALLGGLAGSKSQSDVARNLAKLLATRDRGSIGPILEDWARGLPGGERAPTETAIAGGISEVDPAAAAAFLLGAVPDAASSASAWSSVASAWGRDDPETATHFLAAHEGTIPANAFAGLTREWMRSAPEAASRWIAGLAPGAPKDSAVEALVGGLSRRGADAVDFEAALVWSGELSDPDRARSSAERVLEAWRRSDPATAPPAR